MVASGTSMRDAATQKYQALGLSIGFQNLLGMSSEMQPIAPR
jgi:hypothetical protein